MDVAFGLVSLVLILVIVGFIAGVARGLSYFAKGIIFGLWPAGIGFVACYFLWNSGHDNFGVLAAIAGLYGNRKWLYWKVAFKESQSESGFQYDWRDNKKRIYDRDGNIVGYEDKS